MFVLQTGRTRGNSVALLLPRPSGASPPTSSVSRQADRRQPQGGRLRCARRPPTSPPPRPFAGGAPLAVPRAAALAQRRGRQRRWPLGRRVYRPRRRAAGGRGLRGALPPGSACACRAGSCLLAVRLARQAGLRCLGCAPTAHGAVRAAAAPARARCLCCWWRLRWRRRRVAHPCLQHAPRPRVARGAAQGRGARPGAHAGGSGGGRGRRGCCCCC